MKIAEDKHNDRRMEYVDALLATGKIKEDLKCIDWRGNIKDRILEAKKDLVKTKRENNLKKELREAFDNDQLEDFMKIAKQLGNSNCIITNKKKGNKSYLIEKLVEELEKIPSRNLKKHRMKYMKYIDKIAKSEDFNPEAKCLNPKNEGMRLRDFLSEARSKFGGEEELRKQLQDAANRNDLDGFRNIANQMKYPNFIVGKKGRADSGYFIEQLASKPDKMEYVDALLATGKIDAKIDCLSRRGSLGGFIENRKRKELQKAVEKNDEAGFIKIVDTMKDPNFVVGHKDGRCVYFVEKLIVENPDKLNLVNALIKKVDSGKTLEDYMSEVKDKIKRGEIKKHLETDEEKVKEKVEEIFVNIIRENSKTSFQKLLEKFGVKPFNNKKNKGMGTVSPNKGKGNISRGNN